MAGLLGLACMHLASAAKPSAGCGRTSTLTAGNHTLNVNSKDRWYLLKLPEPYDSSHPYRLIFTLHAAGGNASQVAAGQGGYLPWYGLPALANDTVGAIYVNPNGLNRGWANVDGEDITLMSSIAKAVKADLCVDENLLFSVGFSYGAAMSYAIACSLGKEFRAVGAQSGGSMSGCVGGTDPVAFYGQHGVDGDINITSARQIRDKFVRNNGCTLQENLSPTVGSGLHTKIEYKGCKDGYPVTWIEYDGGHTPQPKDKGQSNTFAADETWKFFSQFK
jgi:poly(3-hydroxybutyrate) depolymerase